MEKNTILGLPINKVSLVELLFNRTMLFAYILLAFGVFGIYEIIQERYFLLTANAFDAGLNPGSKEVALAMKEAIFGAGAEVHRQAPWTLFISNYMYMIYTGSGIIFLVSLGELFDIEVMKQTAAGFLTIGLSMVFGGLFTIIFDLNTLNMLWMFLTPNIKAGMWLMLPLYTIYIPFVLFEIYLILTKNQKWAKKIAFGILLLSIVIDIAEYYIQAKLFDMNSARHLWTTYPILPLYFILSSFLASIGVMILYSFLTLKTKLKEQFTLLINLLQKMALSFILLVGGYEALGFLFIDKAWASIILFSGFHYEFYIYALLTLVLPFGLLISQYISKKSTNSLMLLSSLLIIIGSFIGRFIFVYGGNAYPLSNRFGIGFEKYGEYDLVKEFIYFTPAFSEICIVIGSIGVVFAVYKIFDKIFSVSNIVNH